MIVAEAETLSFRKETIKATFAFVQKTHQSTVYCSAQSFKRAKSPFHFTFFY